jgi:hypothetical protein
MPGSYDHFPKDPRNEPDALEEAEARGYKQPPDVEQPEVDDGTLSEVIRRPTRTAGDLSEVAEGSAEITTEDIARDLESVASRSRAPTDRELLEDLLQRVERIEQHLGIGGPDQPMSYDNFTSIGVKPEDVEYEDADQHPPHDDTSRQQPSPPEQHGGRYPGPG